MFRGRLPSVHVVRALRAGKPKLRGGMVLVVLIAGPPICEYPGVARDCSLHVCASAHGIEEVFGFLFRTRVFTRP